MRPSLLDQGVSLLRAARDSFEGDRAVDWLGEQIWSWGLTLVVWIEGGADAADVLEELCGVGPDRWPLAPSKRPVRHVQIRR
jgi:hypothetical protein